jgi:hypothetical protein
LNAATVPMSGLAAPSRTATPMPLRPMTARVPATMRPCRISSSSTGGLRMAASKASPASILRLTSGLTAKPMPTLCPLARSKRWANSLTAPFAPLPLRTRRSAASAPIARSSEKKRAPQRPLFDAGMRLRRCPGARCPW